MKWFFAILFTLLGLLLVGFFYIPATVVPRAIAEVESRGLLPPRSPRLTLEQVSGTLWDGRAEKTSVEIDGATIALGVLQWHLDKMSLWHRQPRLDLSTRSDKITLTGSVSARETGEILVENLEGHLPIAVLEPWFPQLVTGDIAFVVDHLLFTQQQLLSLDGLLNLEYVDWVGADNNMPLGSYIAKLGMAPNHDLLVDINDLAARLGIDGHFRLNNSGNYRFDATLFPREGLAPEVAQSITWLGKIDRQGNVVIRQNGRL